LVEGEQRLKGGDTIPSRSIPGPEGAVCHLANEQNLVGYRRCLAYYGAILLRRVTRIVRDRSQDENLAPCPRRIQETERGGRARDSQRRIA
jgi:hypothetical protein